MGTNLITLFRVFLTIGAISFGGGMIAYLREYCVKRNPWLTEEEFLIALSLSQTLPGLNGVNLSVIIGDKKGGVWGAILAGLGIVLPGAIIVLIFGAFYAHHSHNHYLNGFLIGVAAAAVGFSLKNTLEIGMAGLKYFRDLFFVIITFIAIGILHIPLLLVLAVLAPIAIWCFRPKAL